MIKDWPDHNLAKISILLINDKTDNSQTIDKTCGSLPVRSVQTPFLNIHFCETVLPYVSPV